MPLTTCASNLRSSRRSAKPGEDPSGQARQEEHHERPSPPTATAPPSSKAPSWTRPRCTACCASCATPACRCSPSPRSTPPSRRGRRRTLTTHTVETDMTTTAVRATTTPRVPMGSTRKTALVAGSFYLITFIASIPAVLLLGPVLHNPDYIVSAGADTRVLWGCFLDVVNALAVVTLRQDLAGATGADTATLLTTGKSLVAVRDWTFLLGPSLMAALNALLLGSLLYRSRLVPRIIPTMGLIGAPLLLAATTATLFGQIERLSVWSGIATLPVAAWELSVGVWMVVKGFKPSPITSTTVPAVARQPSLPVA